MRVLLVPPSNRKAACSAKGPQERGVDLSRQSSRMNGLQPRFLKNSINHGNPEDGPTVSPAMFALSRLAILTAPLGVLTASTVLS